MKHRKRRWKNFAFFDRTGMVNFLEREAEKGWMLEDVSGMWWTFRRGEPSPAHVWVTYLPQDLYDPQPSRPLEDMSELGAHTGWKLMVTTSTIQVFYNWEADPLPMETDPITEVEGMHGMFRKTVLKGSWMWFVGLTVLLMMEVGYLWSSPIVALSSYLHTYLTLQYGILWVLLGTELGGYYLWLSTARRKAQQGVLAETRWWSALHGMLNGVVLVALLLWLGLSLWRNYSASFLWTLLLYAVSALVGVSGVAWMRDSFRRRSVPRERTKFVTSVASFVMVVAILAAAGGLATQMGWFPAGAGDSWWSQHPDGMPLTVEQLRGDVGNQEFYIRRNGEESLVLGYYQGWQIGEDETAEELDTVMYTVTLVKLPALYNLCRDTMLWADHEAVDPTPWLAQEAYRETDHGRLRTYLLCYETCVVEIRFGWDPTEEQMQLVGETFGGDML